MFLFLASSHSVNSPYCAYEVKMAISHKKVIIPLMTENLVLPPTLAKLQWIFLTDFDEAMCELLGGLSSQPSKLWWWQALCVAEAIMLVLTLLLCPNFA